MSNATLASIKFNRANWCVSLPDTNEEDFSKKQEWCVIHCRDWWCLMGPEKWLFGNKEEATQFYMTWADNEV